VEGLFEADPRVDPRARLLTRVERIGPEVLALAGESVSGVGTGGMATKVRAAARATELGIPCIISSGQIPGRLRQVLAGEEVGTLFVPQTSPRRAREAWIAHALFPKGRLVVDSGARRAVVELNKSLLPSGLVRVEGSFQTGDPVDLVDERQVVFARGLVSYSSEELGRLAGRKSAEIEAVLGYRSLDEAVHRNDLVLLGG
jgi:glutamate 5-kinase